MTRPATAIARQFARQLRLANAPVVEQARGVCEQCGDGRIDTVRRWSRFRWVPLSAQSQKTAPHLGAYVFSQSLCAPCWVMLAQVLDNKTETPPQVSGVKE